MFNKNTKKKFHKMQNHETSSLATPLLYQGWNVRGTPRNRKVIWADHTEREEWVLPRSAGSVPQAYSPWPLHPPCSVLHLV